MKKILAAVSSLSMALAMSVAVPAPAMANNGQNNLAEFCRAYADVIGISVGDCVSYFGRGRNEASVICRYWNNNFPVYFSFYWKNVGDCVNDLN